MPYAAGVSSSAIAPRRRLSPADHERLTQAASACFREEPKILAAYLYGSAGRDEPARDLDVALLLDAPLDPARIEALAAELQSAGAPSGPELDLRPLLGTGPRFQFRVLEEGRVLYDRDPRRRLEREASILSQWADFKPTWERMRDAMRQRWLDG